ncbi:MAG: site-2 protease family protein [Solirubrobacteraceae bacterium]
MPGRSIRIARIAGIPVGVSPLWLVIVLLISWSLGAGYYPDVVSGITPAAAYGLGLISTLLLFASILAHEFGHALVARSRGIQVQEIDLWLLGGLARMTGQPKSADDELAFALAGPMVTAVIAAAFGLIAVFLPDSSPPAVTALVEYQAEVNGLILFFNLIPAFPLDGGRVARALLWRRRGDLDAATRTAARLGTTFGYLLVGLGVLAALAGDLAGLWFGVIGLFLVVAANGERLQEQVVAAVTGVTAAELMSHPVVSIPQELTLAEAQRSFTRFRYASFPVIDAAGVAVGILSLDQLARVPHRRWAQLTAGEIAERDPELRIGLGEDVGELLGRPAFAQFGRAVVVDELGRPIGIVSVTDVQRAIRALRLDSGGRRSRGR